MSNRGFFHRSPIRSDCIRAVRTWIFRFVRSRALALSQFLKIGEHSGRAGFRLGASCATHRCWDNRRNANLGRRDRKVNALRAAAVLVEAPQTLPELLRQKERSQIVAPLEIGRASCRERV